MEDKELVNTILDDYLSNDQKITPLEVIESDEPNPQASQELILLPPPKA